MYQSVGQDEFHLNHQFCTGLDSEVLIQKVCLTDWREVALVLVHCKILTYNHWNNHQLAVILCKIYIYLTIDWTF